MARDIAIKEVREMFNLKVLKSLVLGIPLALIVQYFYWDTLLAFTYGDVSFIPCIFCCVILGLVFCVVEVYVVKYDHQNERIPISIIWGFLSVINYFLTLKQLPDDGAGVAEGRYLGELLFYGAVYLIGVYIAMQLSYLMIGEIKGGAREQSKQRGCWESGQGMSAERVLKSLVLGVPLALIVQYFYWKKVVFEIVYGNVLSIECIFYCIVLAFIFCVVVVYVVKYDHPNERIPISVVWVLLSVVKYLSIFKQLPPSDPDPEFGDWKGELQFFDASLYGGCLLVIYAVMQLSYLIVGEIKDWRKNSVKKGWH